jgi:spore germination protein GerM
VTAAKTSARALSAVILLAVWGCSSPESGDPSAEEPVETTDGAAAEVAEDDTASGSETETEEQADEPLRTATVEIYFPSALSDGLVGEFRQIFDTVTPGDRAKQIVADLISGPTSDDCLRAVSPSTRLRQAYVLTDGTAYLDFSSELTEGLGGGSMKELLTVYAIVDSVAFGVREIRRVAILVNGRPLETMNGHLDLRRPLKPNSQWILGSIVVDAGALATPGVAD